jgi:hypothetical protein
MRRSDHCRSLLLYLLVTGCTELPEESLDQAAIEHPQACNCDIYPQPCCCTTPILLDLAGNGIHLTSWQDGVDNFPLDPNRPIVPRAWTEFGTDDGFLTWDRNEDGLVSSGFELFGDVTPQPELPEDAERNGYLALAEFDEDANQIIDSRDLIFDQLRLWQDQNQDAISQPDELLTLAEVRVTGLSTDFNHHHIADQHGNVLRFSATVLRAPGSTVYPKSFDAMLTSPNRRERERHGIVPLPVPEPPYRPEYDFENLPDPAPQRRAVAGEPDPVCFYARHLRPGVPRQHGLRDRLVEHGHPAAAALPSRQGPDLHETLEPMAGRVAQSRGKSPERLPLRGSRCAQDVSTHRGELLADHHANTSARLSDLRPDRSRHLAGHLRCPFVPVQFVRLPHQRSLRRLGTEGHMTRIVKTEMYDGVRSDIVEVDPNRPPPPEGWQRCGGSMLGSAAFLVEDCLVQDLEPDHALMMFMPGEVEGNRQELGHADDAAHIVAHALAHGITVEQGEIIDGPGPEGCDGVVRIFRNWRMTGRGCAWQPEVPFDHTMLIENVPHCRACGQKKREG